MMSSVRRLFAAVAIGALSACSGTSGPSPAPARIAIGGRPFGVAAAATGQVYVTQQDSNSLTGVMANSGARTGLVSVGIDPGDVTFNASASVAYVTNYGGGSVGRFLAGAHSQAGTTVVGSNAVRLRLSGDGARLYVTTSAGWLFILDTSTLAKLDSIAIDADPNGLAIKGDSLAYVSSFSAGRVSEVSLTADSVLRTFPVGGTPQEVVLSSDATRLYVANEAGRVDVVTLASGSIAGLAVIPRAFGMARVPGGDELVATSLSGNVYRVDGSTGNVLSADSVGGEPRRVAIAPDGAILAANEGGWLDIIR